MLLPAAGFGAGVRLRDLAMISGARDNQLVGYGLVAGLAGDGDKDQIYTKQTVANLLMRYGINISAATISAKNVAVVMVTADIPPFLKNGARIDVTVASMGDAKSLSGGVLLQTPLLGADGKVYAVAQGPLVLGGFAAGEGGAGGATVTKNHPTTAQIINGALVEREIPTAVCPRPFGGAAAARSRVSIPPPRWRRRSTRCSPTPRTPWIPPPCRCRCPRSAEGSPVEFIARLNMIEVTPDTPARIIINERTGTIVATAAIHISSCAVASGNITINVASSQDVSQPNALSSGTAPDVTKRTSTSGHGNQVRADSVAGTAHGRKSRLGPERAGRDAARHDVHFPSHETGRRVAGRTHHPLNASLRASNRKLTPRDPAGSRWNRSPATRR